MILPKLICLIWIVISSLMIDLYQCQHMSHYNYRHRQVNVLRSLAQKAYEHGIRINEIAQCSKPKPELIYLNDSKKMYLPRATLLHRCSDLHGCCPHATHSCEPARVEKVTLYFFVIGVQSSNMLRRNQNVEQLTFINHTSCACKPIHETSWTTEHSRFDNSNITQIRLIRDQGSLSSASSASPSYDLMPSSSMIHGRNSFNKNNGNLERDIYQESENILKYWAKLMGYNTEKSSTTNFYEINNNNNPQRNNKKRNTSKKNPKSSSRVMFSTPDITYQYDTIHDPKPSNLEGDYDFSSESPSKSALRMDLHDQNNYNPQQLLSTDLDQRQQLMQTANNNNVEQQQDGYGSMIYAMVPPLSSSSLPSTGIQI